MVNRSLSMLFYSLLAIRYSPFTPRNDDCRNGEGSGVLRRTPHSQRYQPACKPGFVGHRLLAQTIRDGHSSGTTFARCLEQPTRTASLTIALRCFRFRERARVAVPIRSCSRCGLPCRFRRRTRGALLPHLFTLTAPKPLRAKAGGSFSVALSLGLPPPDVIRHRMSMEPGLSSPVGLSTVAGAAVPPTDALVMGV